MVVTMFVLFIVLVMLGVPIAFCLGIAGAYYFSAAEMPLNMMAQRFFGGLNSFTILCVPGFILAGSLMTSGGITDQIIRFCNKVTGHIRGSLAIGNVLASTIFAGVSGSAIADTVSVGGIMIPAMQKDGYDTEFSCAVTCASSCIGPIIPPSIPMIVCGGTLSISVSKLFAASVVPGLLMALFQVIVCVIQSRRRNYPKKDTRATVWEMLGAGRDSIWALLMVVIILVGILGGIVTPTEASVVAVVYAAFVGFCVYRNLDMRLLLLCLRNTVVSTAALMVLVGFANVIGYILAIEQIPLMVANFILSLTDSPALIILMINLLLIVVGMFMESLCAIIILFPTLFAITTAIGMDPVQFGVMGVLNLVIGLCTPPVGICLFAACTIGKASVIKVTRELIPFFIANIGVLILVCLFPRITAGFAALF